MMEKLKDNNTNDGNIKPMLYTTADTKGLFSLLAEYGGSIVNSNVLSPELIRQAIASNRIYVDENSVGYVWEPSFDGNVPMTEKDVELFEKCYPLDIDIPLSLSFENIMKRMNQNNK